MANRSFRKVNSPNSGMVFLPVSFGSGINFAGEQDDAELHTDGYIDDAYGGGFFGARRVDLGEYEVVLNDKYLKCFSATGSIEAGSDADALVEFVYPLLRSTTGADGVKRSFVRVRIQVSGAVADLSHDDRVNLMLCLDNSSVV